MYVHFLTVKEVHRDVKALKNVNAIRDIGSLKYFKACETVDAPRDAAIFVLISFNNFLLFFNHTTLCRGTEELHVQEVCQYGGVSPQRCRSPQRFLKLNPYF